MPGNSRRTGLQSLPMSDELFQPVLVNKTGTHEQLVVAVAIACVQALAEDRDNPVWDRWLAGRFTKKVRRTKKDLSRLQTELGGALVRCGDACALALAPQTFAEMAKPVRDAQMEGTELERTGSWPKAESGLRLVINRELGMSTGKSAAQLAHGAMSWYLRAPQADRSAWLAAGCPISVREVSQSEMDALEGESAIHDAGFTEIAPNSVTVKVEGFSRPSLGLG